MALAKNARTRSQRRSASLSSNEPRAGPIATRAETLPAAALGTTKQCRMSWKRATSPRTPAASHRIGVGLALVSEDVSQAGVHAVGQGVAQRLLVRTIIREARAAESNPSMVRLASVPAPHRNREAGDRFGSLKARATVAVTQAVV
jgi:hypothetical protein